jgi:CheY-like chemotaxis protein
VEALLIVLVVFAFLLIVFFVLAFRFPEDLKLLLRRMTLVEVGKNGLKIGLVAEAVREKEHRKPKKAELEPLVVNIPGDKRVLWVDDCPANNRAEIQALRSLGVTVDTATTNAEGLAYAKSRTYDLVVSDIGRSAPESSTAGLELPGALGEAHVDAPIAFYVGQAVEATTADGDPVFDTPTQLLGWISEHLRGAG